VLIRADYAAALCEQLVVLIARANPSLTGHVDKRKLTGTGGEHSERSQFRINYHLITARFAKSQFSINYRSTSSQQENFGVTLQQGMTIYLIFK